MRPASLALVVAVLAVSWAAILARLCEGCGPLAISFWRLAISAVILGLWMALRGATRGAGDGAPSAGAPGAAALPPWRHAAVAAGAGVLLALHFASWIASLFMTSVASSVVLVATTPLFTLALSPLVLKESPSGRVAAGILLAFLGAATIGGGDFALGGAALAGDILALGGAAFAAGYLVLGRSARFAWPLARYLLVVNGVAALVVGIAALVAGQPLSGYPAATWASLAAMAVGPNLIGHGLLNWAVRRLRAYFVNVAVLGEPILASLYAALLFGERPGPAVWAGAVLVLGGIALAFSGERRS